MPFLYKVEHGYSQKNGKGLYACEDIPAGATYWTLTPHPQQVAFENIEQKNNEVYTQAQFNALTDSSKIQDIINHSYYFSKGLVLIGLFDGCYYLNHDPEGPSRTIYDGDLSKLHSIATRNVKKGEQITESYNHWLVGQCQWLEKVMKDHHPERYEFEMSTVSQMQNKQIEKGGC